MSAAEWCAAIERFRELERNQSLPQETLRDLDDYFRSRIFDENSDLLNAAERRLVQDVYIATL